MGWNRVDLDHDFERRSIIIMGTQLRFWGMTKTRETKVAETKRNTEYNMHWYYTRSRSRKNVQLIFSLSLSLSLSPYTHSPLTVNTSKDSWSKRIIIIILLLHRLLKKAVCRNGVNVVRAKKNLGATI
jgi:hypothetical protein